MSPELTKSSPIVTLEEVSPGVAQITMQDRESKNAFSESLVRELMAQFANVSRDHRYKAVILTGYDTYFASGGTKAGLLAIHDRRTSFNATNFYSVALDCEIPVISAMQGHGIGGGLVMGLFADFVIMSRESYYTANFMRYGFTPGMGATYILPKKLGFSLAHELLLNGGGYRGADLEKRGLPFPVLPRKDVLPHALELAKDLSEKPRLSLVTLKHHLVTELRQELPGVIAKELQMHEVTFHQDEVKQRILQLFP
jgi:polyketide biosynthesis enoyl-CoA hydratase PksI